MMEWMPMRKALNHFRCKEKDVVDAFRVTGQEIRLRLQRFAEARNPAREAALLADRVREQRELVHQITARHHWRSAKNLLRINRRVRNRLLAHLEQVGLSDSTYALRCKHSAGRIPVSNEDSRTSLHDVST